MDNLRTFNCDKLQNDFYDYGYCNAIFLLIVESFCILADFYETHADVIQIIILIATILFVIKFFVL